MAAGAGWRHREAPLPSASGGQSSRERVSLVDRATMAKVLVTTESRADALSVEAAVSSSAAASSPTAKHTHGSDEGQRQSKHKHQHQRTKIRRPQHVVLTEAIGKLVDGLPSKECTRVVLQPQPAARGAEPSRPPLGDGSRSRSCAWSDRTPRRYICTCCSTPCR